MDIHNNSQNSIDTQSSQQLPTQINPLYKIKSKINLKNLVITAVVVIVFFIFYVLFWLVLNYPKGLNAETGRESVNFKWEDVLKLGFSHYEVYRQEARGHDYELLTDTLKENAFEDKACNQGKKHIYRLRAVNIFGLKSKSAESNEVLCPLRPPILKTNESKSSILLEWDNDPLENFSQYNLYRTLASSEVKELLKEGVTDKIYQDLNTENNISYRYWIKVFNTEGLESDFSLVASGKWDQPASPANVKWEKQDNKVVLSWSPNSENDLLGYNVYAAPTSYFEKLNKEPIQGLTYVDSNVNPEIGVAYYAIKAIDKAGNEGGFSNHTKVVLDPNMVADQPSANPQPITIVGLTLEREYENQELVMVIKWTPILLDSFSHYEIYRSTVSVPNPPEGKLLDSQLLSNIYRDKNFQGNGMFYFIRAVYKDGSKSNFTRFVVYRNGTSYASAMDESLIEKYEKLP